MAFWEKIETAVLGGFALLHGDLVGLRPCIPPDTSELLVCYLQRVKGKFEGGGERVEASIVNGRWVLGGSSAQSNIYGEARCVNTAWRHGPITWSQGQAPQAMASFSEWSAG